MAIVWICLIAGLSFGVYRAQRAKANRLSARIEEIAASYFDGAPRFSVNDILKLTTSSAWHGGRVETERLGSP